MRIVTWNIRGLGSKLKVSTVMKTIKEQQAEMVFIQETKKEEFSEAEIGKLWYDEEFDYKFSKASRRSGGILTIWDINKFKEESSLVTSRYILISGTWITENVHCSCINLYAPCDKLGKQALWNEIVSLRNVWRHPWLVGGDFNAVRTRGERKGAGIRYPRMEDFNNFIERCNMIKIPLIGRRFTWISPGSKRSKLDRFFMEEHWFQAYEDITLRSLPWNVSDHTSLLLAKVQLDWGSRPFKVVNTWFRNEDCLKMIKETLGDFSNTRKNLPVKMKKVKKALKHWNASQKNVNSKVQRLEQRINEVEKAGDLDNFDMNQLMS
ncbi:hypothetical protein HRI_003836400 [Hibiscus trionum]|uniref:Endonuclease/exonuclease/phosphatase domain-containing protein n=1 Tax=Hibiscus trionum TaxID=183268 RepID=A0A9W7ISU7_HIBTR|nr:hypothetical protein HRI_003836400 [Hibiscus trionum]